MEFRLPELGEGIADATVVNVPVKVGDVVTAGQTLLEVETDKASMPVPATSPGKITEARVKPGDKIKVGQVVMVLDGQATAAKKASSEPLEVKRKPAAKPPAPHPGAEPSPQPASPPQAAQSSPASSIEFKLPQLGEGIESGTIVSVAVKRGDALKKEQELFTIETDKASVPVPSPVDGSVEEMRVKPGDKVNIGAVVAILSARQGAAKAAEASAPAKTTEAPTPVKAAEAPAPVKAAKVSGPAAVASSTQHSEGNGKSKLPPVPAGPATRRLARELGIDLHDVSGSARGGRVTIDDVKAHTRKKLTQAPQAPTASGVISLPPLPDFSKYGDVEKKPLTNLRRKIAENLTLAWHAAPAVTQFDLADITDLEAGRKRIVDGLAKGSPKVTMTVLAVKAVVAALKEFPNFNSSLDMTSGQQILKRYYHIGIAVDTERGLVVPVIRDADKKSIRDLAKDIAELAEKARAGKLAIDDMRGGSFTITNLGGIGGTAFSPIINYPEAAILGMARSSLQPVVRDGKVDVRLMLPLCLTYDHRIIDGADGARFTTRLVQLFSDPIRLLMES